MSDRNKKREDRLYVLKLSIPDQCLVHRYLYYVKGDSIIEDWEYDIMERKAVKSKTVKNNPNHPLNFPGSDSESSYEQRIIEIANSL